ncbi:MAG: YbhB/YbcL family Raf kinase inhibitor-like protein [Aestuariivirga sp.]
MIMSRSSLAALMLVGFGGPAFAFELSIPSISDGNWGQKFLAKECDGQNLSPALSWKDAPAGTKSFVLTMFDRDALDGFGWWHWQVLKIPANVMGLPEGAGAKTGKGMPKGAVQGKADLGRVGYIGPCPDKGTGVHHYVFTLYALKTAEAETERDASPGMILADVMRETLGKATVLRTYGQ